MSGKKVALLITGIMAGIIAVCVLLAVFIGVPILKNMKYENAAKNAEAGQYVVAIRELEGRNMDDYKDSKAKKQEYALAAAKEYIEDGDTEHAIAMLCIAIDADADEALSKEAEKMFDDLTKDRQKTEE